MFFCVFITDNNLNSYKKIEPIEFGLPNNDYTFKIDVFSMETKLPELYNNCEKKTYNQMNVWMSKSNSNKKFSPLWLKFACNELRIFGEYTTVTKKIEELSLDMDILVTDIIKRIDFEFQNKSIKEV